MCSVLLLSMLAVVHPALSAEDQFEFTKCCGENEVYDITAKNCVKFNGDLSLPQNALDLPLEYYDSNGMHDVSPELVANHYGMPQCGEDSEYKIFSMEMHALARLSLMCSIMPT